MSLNSYLNSKSHPHPLLPHPTTTINNNHAHTTPPSAADAHPAEKVAIITVDGRTLTGTLVSCDQVTNIVLKDTVERIVRPQDDEPLALRAGTGRTFGVFGIAFRPDHETSPMRGSRRSAMRP